MNYREMMRALLDGKVLEEVDNQTTYWYMSDNNIVKVEKDSLPWISYHLPLPGTELRIRPTYIDINGYQVPEPLREVPRIGATIYVANTAYRFKSCKWDGTTCELEWLAKGLIHLTKESRDTHVAALLSFTKEKEEE